MTRTLVLFAAGMLLAALTGCAPTAEAALPTSEPASPTSSVEPEQARTVVAKPALAFDGSCEAMVDDATLSELVGARMAPSTAQSSERVWAIAVLGGSACSWNDEAGQAYVWLDVIPAAGLEAQVAHAEANTPGCDININLPESLCRFSTVVGGYWFTGIVGVTAAARGSALDAIDALTARVAESAAMAGPVPAVRPDGRWSAPADCVAFGAEVDTAGIIGEPFTAEEGGRGGDASPRFVGALDAVGDFPCSWSTPDYARWFSSELLPGAGWAIAELAARDGAAPVEVDGALEAVAVPLGGDTSAVYATDGVNLAWVSVPADIDQASTAALTSAVMAAASR